MKTGPHPFIERIAEARQQEREARAEVWHMPTVFMIIATAALVGAAFLILTNNVP